MRDDGSRLQDILDAIDLIEKYTSEGRSVFDENELIQVWVVHHLQILGEAANKLSSDLRLANPHVPWSKIIGMRHVLVHDYTGVDAEAVWAAVEKDLPVLKSQIEGILSDLGGPA
jgi:uncharacterized protein with HEPN domain